MRLLCGTFFVPQGQRAARLHRHAGMAADRELEVEHVCRHGEGRIDIAEAFDEDRRFGADARREFAGLRHRVEECLPLLDVRRDQFGGVLGAVGIVGEDGGDRLSDIAHDLLRENVLAAFFEVLQCASRPQVDRRNVGDIGAGPDRDDAGHRRRLGRVDRPDAAIGDRRADDAHMQLAGEIVVAGEAAGAGQQLAVLQPRHAPADHGHGVAPLAAPVSSAARTARNMLR